MRTHVRLSPLVAQLASQFVPFFAPLLVVLLSALPSHAAHAQSADEIVRTVVKNELDADTNDHTSWMYRDAYKSPEKNIVKLVIETSAGQSIRNRRGQRPSTWRPAAPGRPRPHPPDAHRPCLSTTPEKERTARWPAGPRHDEHASQRFHLEHRWPGERRR